MVAQTSSRTLRYLKYFRLLILTLLLGYAAKLLFFLVMKDSLRFIVFDLNDLDWLILMPFIVLFFVPAVLIGGVYSAEPLGQIAGIISGLIGVMFVFWLILYLWKRWGEDRLASDRIHIWQRLIQMVFIFTILLIAFLLPIPDIPLFEYPEERFLADNLVDYEQVVAITENVTISESDFFELPEEYVHLDKDETFWAGRLNNNVVLEFRPYDVAFYDEYFLVYVDSADATTRIVIRFLTEERFEHCMAVRESWYLCARATA